MENIEDLDVITSKETEEIQNEILSKLGIDDVQEKPVVQPVTQKKHTKNELIADIMKLEKEAGHEPDEKKYKRMTKNELEKTLADIISKKILPSITEAATKPNALAVRSLNNANMLLVRVLEESSKGFKDKTAGVALLEGWTEQVKKMETEMNEVFTNILAKYGNNVEKYLDPLAQYFMIMMSSAGVVCASNYSKKKEKSEEK